MINRDITPKAIAKDAKDKHTNQLYNKISVEELLKLFTTFKSCDYPFVDEVVDDGPITLKDRELCKFPEKLPTYRMQIADEFSFYLCLKIVISVTKFQPIYDKSMEYIVQLCKHFFNVECFNEIDIS